MAKKRKYKKIKKVQRRRAYGSFKETHKPFSFVPTHTTLVDGKIVTEPLKEDQIDDYINLMYVEYLSLDLKTIHSSTEDLENLKKYLAYCIQIQEKSRHVQKRLIKKYLKLNPL